MSLKVPHCSECSYLKDRGYAEYCRRLCQHPDYANPIYPVDSWMRKLISSTFAATSPHWCPLRGGARQ